MKLTNIAYIHSKICESIAIAAQNKKLFSFSGFVYGRGFTGPSRKSLRLPEDQINNEIMLISYAFLFSRYISFNFPKQEVRLFLPHTNNALLRLMATHKKVVEIYFIEEGDLAYDSSQKNSESPRKIKNNMSESAISMLKSLDYEPDDCDIYPKNAVNFFYNILGKYKGILASDANAFIAFHGNRVEINLKLEKIFERNTAIILVSDGSTLMSILSESFKKSGFNVSPSETRNYINSIIINIINPIVDKISTDVDDIYVKRHPALPLSCYEKIISSCPQHLKDWDNCELEINALCRADFGQINFTHIISIGETSVIRYANKIQPKETIIEYIKEQELANILIESING